MAKSLKNFILTFIAVFSIMIAIPQVISNIKSSQHSGLQYDVLKEGELLINREISANHNLMMAVLYYQNVSTEHDGEYYIQKANDLLEEEATMVESYFSTIEEEKKLSNDVQAINSLVMIITLIGIFIISFVALLYFDIKFDELFIKNKKDLVKKKK